LRIDILSRANGVGGIHMADPEALTEMPTAESVKHDLAVLLAGRAGEGKFLGSLDKVTCGSSNDLERATNLARRAILHWGFDPIFGLGRFEKEDVHLDPSLSALVHKRIQHWLNEALNQAIQILEGKSTYWSNLQKALVEKEVLLSPDLEEVFQQSQPSLDVA
jgi:cell division protease FtsH